MNPVKIDWTTVTIATMDASPSITADTVTALRPGLRCRLLRAIAPSQALKLSRGALTQFAIGFTTAGATSAIPTRKTTDPNPTRPAEPEVSPNRDATSSAAPIQARRPTRRSNTSPNCGRIASIGVTRPAARAGTTAARMVTPTPSTIASAQVAAVNNGPPMVKCITDLKIGAIAANSPAAIAQPAAMPSAVPTTPWTRDSIRKSLETLRLVIPIARSMPMSRRRSATTVRKLFRMMNPAVARAKMPNMLNANCATCSEASSDDSVESPPTW